MLTANDPRLSSWIVVDKSSDFPIQNLPFGIFMTHDLSARVGVAIGSFVVDMLFLHENGYFKGLDLPLGIFDRSALNDFMALGRVRAGKVRERLSELLRHDNPELRDNANDRSKCLLPMDAVKLLMPIRVGDYTDFYSSVEHATNVGIMFRDPANALLPNWKHLPVGYHGRASSIVVSGTPIHRPMGQAKDAEEATPHFGPSQRLDFELEMAFVTCTSTALGDSISIDDAEKHIFGMVLFNDWSARDIQAWEYVPLGPFLGKNFGSSISPWVVTLDALEPFRCAGPVQDVPVLPYLQQSFHGNFDIQLEVSLQPDQGTENVICKSNFKYMYWSMAQQLAHHTVNGCNINIGDLYGSGTISGPTPDSYGSMLELAWKGTKPLPLSDGSQRKFLHDGDTVVMRGWCEHDGVRVGFGEVSGKILPPKP